MKVSEIVLTEHIFKQIREGNKELAKLAKDIDKLFGIPTMITQPIFKKKLNIELKEE